LAVENPHQMVFVFLATLRLGGLTSGMASRCLNATVVAMSILTLALAADADAKAIEINVFPFV
jgi:hypothetical protein